MLRPFETLIVGAVIFLYKTCFVYSECIVIKTMSGRISGSHYLPENGWWVDPVPYLQCWKINLPENHFIRLTVKHLKIPGYVGKGCPSYLQIEEKDGKVINKFCRNILPEDTMAPFNVMTDAKVKYMIFSSSTDEESYFHLDYEIKKIECSPDSFYCTNSTCVSKDKICDGVYDCENFWDEIDCEKIQCLNDSFHCTNDTCVSKDKICDGVYDCENFKDEIDCGKGVLGILGVSEAREKAISLLKSKRKSNWGWTEDTARALTALYLGGGAKFDKLSYKEELMAKQAALETAVTLLKNPVPIIPLSMFINALLVTCQDPRHFYGHDLVKVLKNNLNLRENFTHPVAYLALCNAKEPWLGKATKDLTKIMGVDPGYSIFKDYQAFAIMAVACAVKENNNLINRDFFDQYGKLVKEFKKQQLPDGSFGSTHSTSLITQSLLASGQELVTDWKLNATIKYLISEIKSSNVDFITLYLTLPVLNGKSLADIASVNCSGNPSAYENDVLLQSKESSGSKMRIQYSLYLGDEKDVIHTISLRVPENSTAFRVMELAVAEDQKYKFESKSVSEQKNVYKIAKTSNDPENGLFWFLYLGTKGVELSLVHHTENPDQLTLKDEDHLILWYKSPEI